MLDAAQSPALDELDALVVDFDGTLTDDRVTVDQDGRESVSVHRGDGLGIAALRRGGLDVLILSTERNPVVSARARKLNIPALTGVDRKGEALTQWCADNGHALSRTAYVGNDVNDLPCFDLVGWPIAVADAHHSVRARARIVTAAPRRPRRDPRGRVGASSERTSAMDLTRLRYIGDRPVGPDHPVYVTGRDRHQPQRRPRRRAGPDRRRRRRRLRRGQVPEAHAGDLRARRTSSTSSATPRGAA